MDDDDADYMQGSDEVSYVHATRGLLPTLDRTMASTTRMPMGRMRAEA